MCGEKCGNGIIRINAIGSPPRVRGKGPDAPTTKKTRRITPACAGKRHKYVFTRRICKDHPRVCGEKWIYFVFVCSC